MLKTLLQQEDITYSIQAVARRTGLSEPALRYYEEKGLIPAVQRDPSSRHRRYDAETVQVIESLANLRAVGMSLNEMRAYLQLRAGGDETAHEKMAMFQAHAAALEEEIARLRTRQRYLTFKVAYWDARARGDLEEAARIAEDYEEIVRALR
jgi:DNA-binding transcriptional MerR regulator